MSAAGVLVGGVPVRDKVDSINRSDGWDREAFEKVRRAAKEEKAQRKDEKKKRKDEAKKRKRGEESDEEEEEEEEEEDEEEKEGRFVQCGRSAEEERSTQSDAMGGSQ